MGGIGKSVLAQALCRDPVVQQAFPDGIVWVTAGKESAYDLVTRMREVGKALNDDLNKYDNELGCIRQYRTTLKKKAALIVVDDVWRSRDIVPFRAESPRSRLLFTTRISEIAADLQASEHSVDLLSFEQARELLATGSGTPLDQLPVEAGDLIAESGRLPLALSMIAAMLRGKPRSYWKLILAHLRAADLAKIKAEFPDYPYTGLLRAIQVSVGALDEPPSERYLKRYLALAVLLDDMPIARPIQEILWGVDEGEAEVTAEHFVSLSLAQRESQDSSSIRLHDLQLDYTRALYPNKEDLKLIHGAVRLSSHVLVRDAAQFASQVIGRLLPYIDQPTIAHFVESLKRGAPRPWLRVSLPALHPPGTPLLRTLQGHSSDVHGVALISDDDLFLLRCGKNFLNKFHLD